VTDEFERRETALLIEELQERQALLERLSELQRAIVNRTALGEVLELLAARLAESVGGALVAIRLLDPESGEHARLVTSLGADGTLIERWRDARPVHLLSRTALEEGRTRLVAHADPAAAEAEFAAAGVRSAIVAPLLERGEVAGSLAVGRRGDARPFDRHDEAVVIAFAEHGSLALNDARAAKETTHQAFHDALTGLPNRALFNDRLDHAIARTEREDVPLAVLFCDLDGFKTVNDSLGHAAGDRLLQAVGRRLEASLRPADTVARFGGDEFAILLEDLAEGGATAAAGRVLHQLAEPFEIEGRELAVSASIGIATPEPGDDAGAVLRNADLAMYRAKARGKGRFETFEPAMHAEVVRRMEMELDLARAIEREQIVVHYQPIFDLPSGEVAGLEALVRWDHPTAGLIHPAEFIPIAEESGQIVALGRHVLREACRRLALWRARYPAYDWLYVSVNVSGVQLREPGFVDEVDAALRAAEVDPSHLLLEMTETVLMEDSHQSKAMLEALRGLGVRLAIDDFGTGYSSLEYLDRLPIDALKIAKPFVDRLGAGPGSDAIPRAIADLADIFGLVVIAEGIEDRGQAELLVELGCRFGQGNAFAPALPAHAADGAIFGAGLLAGEPLTPEGQTPTGQTPKGQTAR
jgi:diguanylate cyclase (GGDEF)-like protein